LEHHRRARLGILENAGETLCHASVENVDVDNALFLWRRFSRASTAPASRDEGRSIVDDSASAGLPARPAWRMSCRERVTHVYQIVLPNAE
jgi:hypothetical protein